MSHLIWHRCSCLTLTLVMLSIAGCRKEIPKDPVEQSNSDKIDELSSETDPVGSEDIAGAALEDTGMKQELIDPVEIPPVPSFGQNLKGWKPAKSEKEKKSAASIEKYPKDMWVLADILSIRTGPATKFPQTGSLPYGEKVSVLGVTDNFANIGEHRFVALRYLTDRKSKFIPAKK